MMAAGPRSANSTRPPKVSRPVPRDGGASSGAVSIPMLACCEADSTMGASRPAGAPSAAPAASAASIPVNIRLACIEHTSCTAPIMAMGA